LKIILRSRGQIFEWSKLKDEEEQDRIEEVRKIAQEQFIDLSVKHVDKCQENDRLKLALKSAQRRAKELGTLLREEA
jgi:hypothetical protein